MKPYFFLLKAILLVCAFVGGGMEAGAQSDFSKIYTSKIGILDDRRGSQISDCLLDITENGVTKRYKGLAAGTSNSAGEIVLKMPKNTKYFHFHAVGWNNDNVELTMTYTIDNKTKNVKISLTTNDGIHNDSPFTFNGDPSTTNYYKVLTLSSPLTKETEITIKATTGKRFVLWGVNPERETPTSVTITSAKYATFSSDQNANFSTTGITVYKAKVENNVVKLTEVADGIVPANTGVILYSETVKNNVTVPVTNNTYAPQDNEMVATVERTWVTQTSSDGKYNYVMQLNDEKVVFNMAGADGGYMPAGKAYLSTAVGASTAGARLSVVFDERPAGISDQQRETTTSERCYNLNGQCVAQPKKGLYILRTAGNGGRAKKVFVK